MINGWLLIDKPEGISSYTVIRKIKSVLKNTKVGHAGTLDPLASGVLAVALGEATKTVDFIMNKSKTYEFTIQFGIATNTYDKEGEIIERSTLLPSKQEIEFLIPNLIGECLENPPIFSAIKINGVRAYKLARANKEVRINPRKIIIYNLELINYCKDVGQATFKVEVSKGAYIRSLGVHIAKKLGSIGCISYLRRLKIAGFKEIPLLKMEELYNIDRLLQKNLYCIEDVLDDIPAINLDKIETNAILQGKSLILTKDRYSNINNYCYKALYKGKLVSLLTINNEKTKIIRNFNQVDLIDS